MTPLNSEVKTGDHKNMNPVDVIKPFLLAFLALHILIAEWRWARPVGLGLLALAVIYFLYFFVPVLRYHLVTRGKYLVCPPITPEPDFFVIDRKTNVAIASFLELDHASAFLETLHLTDGFLASTTQLPQY